MFHYLNSAAAAIHRNGLPLGLFSVLVLFDILGQLVEPRVGHSAGFDAGHQLLGEKKRKR